ncbi:MAG: hypothetical protein LBR26_16975 [Prevotella sp.]|nr:hypothetical protein [Prevotella sp.]
MKEKNLSFYFLVKRGIKSRSDGREYSHQDNICNIVKYSDKRDIWRVWEDGYKN